ncbi:MAG: dephospho-CoA kinase [Proteobacteria bacterium]|nr:dephospho-CoA kinase [Cystobacterineae bacterium]MCL2258804.1 dephospho-CoA kinase [Cystobacterineae bacterium]MCL2314812.1 dephospho-CoA kinase [Pseudomonadota bacterium]
MSINRLPTTTLIGLTGGIASGKTTAAHCLQRFGFEIIEADVLAKHVFEERLQEIKRLFPEIAETPTADFRSRLAEEIFANSKARLKLNTLMHPAIHALMKKHQRQFEAKQTAVVFYDAPLLFETGSNAFVKATLLIYAPYEMQLQRLMERNAYSKQQAIRRMASQMDIESKRQRATWVVENLGSKEALYRQLDCWRKEKLNAFLSTQA